MKIPLQVLGQPIKPVDRWVALLEKVYRAVTHGIPRAFVANRKVYLDRLLLLLSLTFELSEPTALAAGCSLVELSEPTALAAGCSLVNFSIILARI